MTDISCKGAGSWSALEKNGFRTFCAIYIYIFLKELQINSDMDKNRGKKAAPTHNKVFKRI